MKNIVTVLLILAALNTQAQHKGKWKQLFNGKNLKGWSPKITGHPFGDNYNNTFRVVDGKITVNYDQYTDFKEQFGHLFYKTPYSHYIIAVEYRFTGQQIHDGPDWAYRNSGFMIHCQPPATMLLDQDFPISIEVQLLGGDSTGERTTCNLCTPGTNVVMNNKLITSHCVNSKSKTYRNDEWVRAEVEVYGDSLIRHIVNGDTVLVYQKPQTGGGNVIHFDKAYKPEGKLLNSGYISLQSESHPIEFRKVEILDLDGKAGRRKGGRK